MFSSSCCFVAFSFLFSLLLSSFFSCSQESLGDVQVCDVPVALGRIIEIDSQCSLDKAFLTLLDNNILSAPVFDSPTSQYTGFLDVTDLVAFSVFATTENEIVRDLQELLTRGAKMHERTQDGITVSYLSRRHPFKPVAQNASLLEVCQILATGRHRVPVLNEAGRVVNIVSQSSVISFFLKSCVRAVSSSSLVPYVETFLPFLDFLPWLFKQKEDPLLMKSVRECNLGTSPVISVSESDSAFAAFTKLDNTGRSGLAVVDGRGQIVANTSSSDIKVCLYLLLFLLLCVPHQTLKPLCSCSCSCS